jgi:DNA repair exonuclease SbcCD nuclease subunit
MREQIRVLHAADLHLDSPFEALEADKAALRRAEQRALLGRIAELAQTRQVDLVLLPGDLLDSGSSYRETAISLCDALSRMEKPVFIAPGNHDCYSPRAPWARLELPENVHVFTSGAIERVELPQLDAEVFGAAFTDESAPPLLRYFTPPENAENRIRLLCLHGEVGSGEGKYDPITEEELARSGMHYAALGHSHAYSGLRRAGDVFYAWPGCAEGRGFDETGEKGVVLADVRRDGVTVQFVPTAARRYHRVELDVGEGTALVDAALEKLPATAARDAFLFVLKGETETPPDLGALRAALEERVFALRLRDETRPAPDVWAAAQEDSLRGLFLRRLREKLDAAVDEPERERLLLALRFARAAMDNAEEPHA